MYEQNKEFAELQIGQPQDCTIKLGMSPWPMSTYLHETEEAFISKISIVTQTSRDNDVSNVTMRYKECDLNADTYIPVFQYVKDTVDSQISTVVLLLNFFIDSAYIFSFICNSMFGLCEFATG